MIIFLPWHKQNSVLLNWTSAHSVIHLIRTAHSYWAYGMQTTFDSTPGPSQLFVSKSNQPFVKRRSLIAENSAKIGLCKIYYFLLALLLQRQPAEEWANCREKSIIWKMSRSAALHAGIALTPPLEASIYHRKMQITTIIMQIPWLTTLYKHTRLHCQYNTIHYITFYKIAF